MRILTAFLAVLIASAAAAAQTVTMGVTTVLSGTDGGNGNLLLAQSATLSQNSTIQSISFYVVQASGNLILGVYDSSGPGGGPGKLVASTAQFTPTIGWNTKNVTSQVPLTAGTYWLAYNPSSNNLEFPVERNTGNCAYYSHTSGTSLPATFSTSPTSCTPANWSIYASLVNGAPVNTATPVISGSTVVGDMLTTTTGAWTNNPTSYSYQWYWADVAQVIAGATSSSYTLQSADAGHTIDVDVTATNSSGSGSAYSSAVGPVTSSGGGGQMITMGVTSVLSDTDGGNGNLLLAQLATLSQNATIQSISFYAVQASGNLILGVYDSSGPGGGPGKLVASTAQFTPTTGWNTENVISQVVLTAGTYWLAYNPSSNNLEFPVERTTGTSDWYSYTENGSLPSIFSTSPSGATGNWSIYATLQVGGVGGAPVNTAPPVISGSTVVGDMLTTTTGTWTNNPTSYSYQWYWADVAQVIAGATSSSYILQSADVGHTIKVDVTATNSSGSGSAYSSAVGPVTSSGGSSGVPFTPLHLYYMSPTGSDSNSGTSASSPWLTPNHAVNCGDVIIAAAGTYTNQFNQSWGTVSNCPSTSGGIDGRGGVYFATILCAGPDLEACQVNSGGNAAAFDIQQQSNWAVEGFKATSGGANTSNQVTPAFAADCGISIGPCNAGIFHHFAFINDVAYDSSDGFGLAGCCGNGSSGIDYIAVVGDIAENSAQGNPANSYCVAAIDIVGPINYDTKPGTHMYVYGNFSYNNRTSCATDVENYMFDTWDVNGYSSLGVAQNNMGWLSGRFGLHVFDQQIKPTNATVSILNNTLFGSNQLNDSCCYGYANGDINIANSNSSGNSIWGGVTIQDNLVQKNQAWQGGNSSGYPVFAFVIGGPYSNVTVGGNGSQNYFYGLATDCNGNACLPSSAPYGAESFGAESNLGTNYYTSPAFQNTSDLISNQSGTPNCTGFSNTTICMGYNANTHKLINPSAIYDLQPTASGASAAGYQLPSTNCVTSGPIATYYPTWLKGIVYLQWDSSTQTITENSDLVTKPCGL